MGLNLRPFIRNIMPQNGDRIVTIEFVTSIHIYVY